MNLHGALGLEIGNLLVASYDFVATCICTDIPDFVRPASICRVLNRPGYRQLLISITSKQ